MINADHKIHEFELASFSSVLGKRKGRESGEERHTITLAEKGEQNNTQCMLRRRILANKGTMGGRAMMNARVERG